MKKLKIFSTFILDEATNVIDEMELTTHELIDRQNIIKQYENHISELEEEVQNLKLTIQSEKNEITSEVTQIKGLEKSYDKQKSQLTLLQKTIHSINENKVKLREMVRHTASHVIPILDDIDRD